MNRTFVFGYGSLMNEADLQRTLPGKKIHSWATLKGWRRKFNKGGIDHRYLNLVPTKPEDNAQQVKGVLVEVNLDELEILAKREKGYNVTDVTRQIVSPPENAEIIAFIAPPFDELPVRGSYLERVLRGLPPEERKIWIEETDFDGAEIDKDS